MFSKQTQEKTSGRPPSHNKQQQQQQQQQPENNFLDNRNESHQGFLLEVSITLKKRTQVY